MAIKIKIFSARQNEETQIDEVQNEENTGGVVFKKSNSRNQYIAGIILWITASGNIGTMLGFSAILLPQLEDENVLLARSEDASWVASCTTILHVLGSIILGIMAGTHGRKLTTLFSCLLVLVSWIIIGFSDGNYTALIIGRIIQGLSMLASVSQVYLAELGDSKRRSKLAGLGSFYVASGITFVYFLGAVMPWRWVCLVCAILPTAGLILIWKVVPETPTWLVHHGKIDEARKAILWLRGPDYDADSEIRALEATRGVPDEDDDDDQEQQEVSPLKKLKILKTLSKLLARMNNLYLEMSKPRAYKPFFLLVTMFMMQQGCASYAVIFYAVNVFEDAGVSISPYIAIIILGVVRQIGSLLGAILLNKYARKKLMIYSGLIMGSALLTLGFTIQENLKFKAGKSSLALELNITLEEMEMSSLENALAIMPIVEVVIYMLAFGAGIGTIPWLLIGELLPMEVKGFGSGLVACVGGLVLFLVVKTFPLMVRTLGADGAYFVYSGICFATALHSVFFVPETRGKTLSELQTLYESKEGDDNNTKSSYKLHCIKERFTCKFYYQKS